MDPRPRAVLACAMSPCAQEGIRRLKKGWGFAYRLPSGKWLEDPAELARVRQLAQPPAWTKVWICADPHGHLQATDFDAKGRKQYRYDVRWRAARDVIKYQDLLQFSAALPRLRRQLERDLARRGLPREKVLAPVVSLIAETGVRVGSRRYQEENGSFGLTTLLDRHATVSRESVTLAFRGKGGKPYRAAIQSRKLARVVRRCRDVPGQRLFQYRYVHPGLVEAFLEQRLPAARASNVRGLRASERDLVSVLKCLSKSVRAAAPACLHRAPSHPLRQRASLLSRKRPKRAGFSLGSALAMTWACGSDAAPLGDKTNAHDPLHSPRFGPRRRWPRPFSLWLRGLVACRYSGDHPARDVLHRKQALISSGTLESSGRPGGGPSILP